ncbi:MAG: hypothetical protein AAGD43_03465 [Pseudomonadota bacterium]
MQQNDFYQARLTPNEVMLGHIANDTNIRLTETERTNRLLVRISDDTRECRSILASIMYILVAILLVSLFK